MSTDFPDTLSTEIVLQLMKEERMIETMNRGNSIIAGVVLIGILGTLSIALQATAPTMNSMVQVPVSPVTQVAATQATELPKMGCFPGFDYTSFSDPKGDIKVGCKQRQGEQYCRGFGTSKGSTKDEYKKAGAIPECISAVENAYINYNPSAIKACEAVASSDKEKGCVLRHCFQDKQGRNTRCVDIKNGDFKAEDGFAPKKNPKFATDQLDQDLKAGGERAQKAADIMSGMKTDAGTQQVLDSFNKTVEEQQAKTDLYKDACSSPACSTEDVETAKKKYEEEKKKLDAMKEMQKRLGSQTGELGAEEKWDCLVSTSPQVVKKGTYGPGCVNYRTGGGPPLSSSEINARTSGPGEQRPSSTGFNPNGFLTGLAQGLLGGSQTPQQQTAQQNAQAVQQQCQPRYFCLNNTLYWGSQNSVTQYQYQDASAYSYYGGSSYTPYTSACPNQVVQQCQYGCAPGGTQCSPNPAQTGQQPVATITCVDSNALFDVGMSVPISFSCTNAVSSTGGGFSTGGALSGTITTTIKKPPAGTDIVSYGLTCAASNNQTVSAHCEVKINLTSIVLVANPKQVSKNATSTIGWVTKGMDQCTIWSPDAEGNSDLGKFNEENAENTSVAGVAITPPLIKDTEFALSCLTKGGQDKSASVKVKVKTE